MKTLNAIALRLYLTVGIVAGAILLSAASRRNTRGIRRHLRRGLRYRSVQSDRGDVPGWVMITMMTAIVVIVLLGVFKDAVVDAVTNAFQSVQDAG